MSSEWDSKRVHVAFYSSWRHLKWIYPLHKLCLFHAFILEGLQDIFLFHSCFQYSCAYIHSCEINMVHYDFCFSHWNRPQKNFFSSFFAHILLLIWFLKGLRLDVAFMTEKCMKIFMNPIMDFLTLFSSFIAMTFYGFSLFSTSAKNGDGFAIKIFSHESLWIWRWIWYHKALEVYRRNNAIIRRYLWQYHPYVDI